MATTASGYGDGNVSIGRVLGNGFGTIAANPIATLGIALVFSALPGQLFGIALRPVLAGALQNREATIGAIGIAVVSMGVTLVLAMITQGALVRITLAHAAGRRATIGESLAAGLRVALPLIGLAIVSWFAITIGFLLLVVPGVILFVMWAVATPALVEQRNGIFAALGRSRRLTKGARWRVFGLWALLLVGYWMILALATAATVTLNGGVPASPLTVPTIPVMLLNAVVGTVVGAIWSTVASALYVELRSVQDGPDNAELADVFA